MYIPIGPSKKQLYKIIICLLLAIYLIFLGMYKPKADVVYNGTITPTIARLRQSPNGQIDAGFENNLAHIQLSGDNIKTSHTLSIFFNALTYHGYTGYRYKFSGFLNSYQWAYSTITAVDIQNGNGETIGVCEYTANGNQTQYQSFTLDCMVPSGLSYGAYANIIDFQFSTLGNTPENNTSFDIYINEKMAVYKVEDSNSQIASDTNDIKNNLNDSSIDNSSANDLTNNSAFQDSNGLDNIIKAPLNFIQSLTSTTCSAINLTIPFMNADVSLPCMSSVYTKALGQQLVNLISLVINGVVLYRYCLKILQLVHNAKNPNKDELEVLDL